MAEITASMVMKLRGQTDAPMMDCKKALTEAEGDMTRAEEILRVRFGNKASKAAGRIAAEGVVSSYITKDRKFGSLLEVNSETDFCAKNEEFLNFTNEVAKAIVDQKLKTIDSLNEIKIDNITIEELRTQLIGKIK